MSKTLTDIACHVRQVREKAVAVADGTADTFPDCRWQTPVSHGSHVLTLKTGLGYRILRRQPAKLRDGRGR